MDWGFNNWYDYTGLGYALDKGYQGAKEAYNGMSTPFPQGIGGPSPYQGNWNQLITQLQGRANGSGPSLAGDAFQKASQTGLAEQSALSHGRGAGAATQATTNMANINQGQTQGYQQAQLGEEMANTSALGGALTGAGNAWMQPQQLSLQAWATQNGMDMAKLQALAGMFGQGAKMFGGGGAAGA